MLHGTKAPVSRLLPPPLPPPQEESEYYQRLGMTIELMNKNIFRELIFAEAFMSSNLPLIIAQLRQVCVCMHACVRACALIRIGTYTLYMYIGVKW